MASSSAVNLAGSGAAFDIRSGGNQTTANLSGVAGSTITLGGNTLTVNESGASAFAGDPSVLLLADMPDRCGRPWQGRCPTWHEYRNSTADANSRA